VTSRSWAPQAALVAVGWAFAVVAALCVIFLADRPGKVLLAVAAALLVVLSLHGTVARPRLLADEQGLTVRGLFGRRHFPWTEVRFRVAHGRRLGRTSATVELTVLPDDDLVILGRLDLGADPVDVVEQLSQLRPWQD
jgi:Bacterial PH domain